MSIFSVNHSCDELKKTVTYIQVARKKLVKLVKSVQLNMYACLIQIDSRL